MIDWSWADVLAGRDAEDVDALVGLAAAYDAEAGFSTPDPEAPATGDVHHLLVTMPPPGSRDSAELDALPDVRVIAYLRLDVQGDTGTAQFVVHPEFRSLGVATLLLERLDDEGGWRVAPDLRWVQVWAHGAHPAAERMRTRFGADLEHAVFKTQRVLGGSRPFRAEVRPVHTATAAVPPPEPATGHHATMNPADRAVLQRARTELTVDGAAGRVFLGADVDEPARETAALEVDPGDADRDAVAILVAQGLLVLQDAGARVAQCHVDAFDDQLVSVSRELGLAHDQSDFLYRRALPA